MIKINSVVFDLGNVLIDWDPRYLYRKLFQTDEEVEWFLENICDHDWNLKHDSGQLFSKGILEKLCSLLGIPFRNEMLEWPEGPRDTDGVWAKHWYSNGEASTGFKPYEERKDELPYELEEIYEECLVYYDTLHRKRIY